MVSQSDMISERGGKAELPASRRIVDMVLHVGDYIYESRGDGSKDSYGDGRPFSRVPQPNKEIVTLSDYRIRYATYRSDLDLQALHQSKSWLLIWDDHEVADNVYKAGTADSNDTAAGTIDGVRFTERKMNAVKAYFEWMPIRQVDSAKADTLRIWRKFQYGQLADIAMLDTRNYDRDLTDLYYNTDYVASIANDTNRSLMGGKQERWLYQNLVESQQRGATWKIIGQQIIVNHLEYGEADFPVDYDAWDGYESNRRRMFDTIRANKVENVIFLSGDSHAAWAYDTIYQEWVNSTDLYDPSTGQGSFAVEFAGTAVSSPSSYGRNLTKAKYQATSEKLVKINRNLVWAEGALRGYFTLDIRQNDLDAQFYGIPNNTLPHSDQILLSTFNVKRGANKITRPINGGKKPASGVIQANVVDYKTQKWNGTAFA
jgi:alkaline phosphatase D